MTDATKASMSEKQLNETSARLSPVRATLEILGVLVSSFAGLVLGSLTGWLPMSPILGMVFPLFLATLFLRREGKGWPDIGFPKQLSWWRFIGYTLAALALTLLANGLVVGPLLNALNAPATDITLLTDALEGNTLNYVVFMVFIVWGSAAFGEELIVRGFILDRFSKLFGTSIAVVAQAAIFALAHSYQGITGVVTIFVLAVIFGGVYIRSGRNLLPVIVAHGILDSIGITAIYLGYSDVIIGG
jgi:membrane protease YdiL (CAAX protease family)